MKSISFKKPLILFAIIWLHVSLLNLFFVNYSGPVFLWKENSEPTTLLVHFLIAATTTTIFLFGQFLHQRYQSGAFRIREPILIFASMCMILSIGFMLFE
ncbi:hypothetical protein [Thalassotalea atypica]|uniref:hypothetical protein n=1 Tax=Thalassotalea atypica TaxID=2054316 RepID=UPI002572D124|nr:hypothetical protein [Thalassotalea atypica]